MGIIVIFQLAFFGAGVVLSLILCPAVGYGAYALAARYGAGWLAGGALLQAALALWCWRGARENSQANGPARFWDALWAVPRGGSAPELEAIVVAIPIWGFLAMSVPAVVVGGVLAALWARRFFG